MGRLRSASLLLLLLAPAAAAEEPPVAPPAPAKPAKPAGPSLTDRLAAVRKLMKGEKWQQALTGLRAVFEELKDSPEVIRQLPAIEEDLKTCTFRAQAKPPAPEEIFGAGTKSFTAASRLLVIELPAGPLTAPWEGKPEDGVRLMVRFEDVTVDYEGGLDNRLAADLSFDFEAETGYDLRAGGPSTGRREQASIARLDNATGGAMKSAGGMATADNTAGPGNHKVRFSKKGPELAILLDGRPLVSTKDAKFPKGYLGIRGAQGGTVAIRGTVDAAQVRVLTDACTERRFKEWTAKSWKREEAIPEWARKEEK